jgi:hypothetical protein
MGLSIYYRGTLRSPELITLFVEDVMDICLEIGWKYHPIHLSEIMPAKGLLVEPKGSEPLVLTFLENGRLYNCLHFIFTRYPEIERVDEKSHEWMFTKTRYAGADIHMAIIELFRYLKEKYFTEFELYDESGYWETYDIRACLQHFGEYTDPTESASDVTAALLDLYNDDKDDEPAADRMHELLLRRGSLGINLN